jgi:hypothetical protein
MLEIKRPRKQDVERTMTDLRRHGQGTVVGTAVGQGDVYGKGGCTFLNTQHTKVGGGKPNGSGAAYSYDAPARWYHRPSRLVHELSPGFMGVYRKSYGHPTGWVMSKCGKMMVFNYATREGEMNDANLTCMSCLNK